MKTPSRSFTVGLMLASIPGSACLSSAESLQPRPETSRYQHRAPLPWVGPDGGGGSLRRDCGTLASVPAGAPPAAIGNPSSTRGWEVIPGVVRADGAASFRLEVSVEQPVQGVSLTWVDSRIVAPGQVPLELTDDGTGEDRVAEDRIYTAGPFRIKPESAGFILGDYGSGGSPANLTGQNFVTVGSVEIRQPGIPFWHFIVDPDVGVISDTLIAPFTERIATNLAIAPHVANVATDFAGAQTFLRYHETDNRLARITGPFSQALPEAFDFIILLSTHHLERLDGTRNYVAGTHLTVRRNYTGTGAPTIDNTASYGTNRRLLSINILDAGFRGINAAAATHEVLHQWGAYLPSSLRIGDGIHHHNWSSLPSLLGGFPWIDLGDGNFRRDCGGDGANGAHRIAPLDQYMMGLLDASQVAPIRWESVSLPTPINCDGIITGVNGVTTIEDIISVAGPRTPGPAQAQREFRIAFVVESNGRLLDANEMTFYERLAEHFTKAVPAVGPSPFVGGNWVPITRFFGEETQWSSSISEVRTRMQPLSANLILLWVEDAFATASYRIESAETLGYSGWTFQGRLENSASTLAITNRRGSGFFRARRENLFNPD